jgi:ABC-type phosphate transport system substrate-binding protein
VVKKTTVKRWTFLLLSVLLFLRFSASAAAGEVVIGHTAIKVDKLTRQQVSDLFLRKVNELSDGTKVTVFDHKDDELIKQAFYRRVMNMTLGQLQAYWSKAQSAEQIFPPLAYSGDQAVKRLVSNTLGGIGYIEEGAVDGTVKVLFKP